MARELVVLSAGAARAVVLALQRRFEAQTGTTLRATFGAVGAMRELFDGGAACDAIVLSARLIDEMVQSGLLDPASRISLGRVRTGVAVRAGEPLPQIDDADALRRSFLAAEQFFLPDPERATAGIHCADVLRRLGILETLRPRLRPHPSGAIAMAELARTFGSAIGCTQVTEILYTPGVTLVGPLPDGFDLATEYAAAVPMRSGNHALAGELLAALGGDATLAARRAGGFEF